MTLSDPHAASDPCPECGTRGYRIWPGYGACQTCLVLRLERLKTWPSPTVSAGPPAGRIIGSCGHEVQGLGFAVEYHSESCDALEGYVPCIVYATYCAACTAELVLTEEFIRAERLGVDIAP